MSHSIILFLLSASALAALHGSKVVSARSYSEMITTATLNDGTATRAPPNSHNQPSASGEVGSGCCADAERMLASTEGACHCLDCGWAWQSRLKSRMTFLDNLRGKPSDGDILGAFETHSVTALRAAIAAGFDVRASIRGKASVNWLTEMHSRGADFPACLRLLLDSGAALDDPVLAPVLLNDAEMLAC